MKFLNTNQKQNFESRVEQLNATIQSYTESNATLKATLSHTEKSLIDKQSKCLMLTNELEKKKELESSHTLLTSKHKKLGDSFKRLEAELISSNDENTKLIEENSSLSKLNLSLANQIQEKDKKIEALRSELTALEKA